MRGMAAKPGARDESGLDDKLALEQLKLAIRNVRPNVWIMPVIAAVICAMFAQTVAPLHLATWFLLVTFGALAQAAITSRMERQELQVSEARKWIALGTVAFTIFAVCWSSIAVFLWVANDVFNLVMIMLIVGCTLAGSAAVSGVSLPLNIVSLFCYGTMFVMLPLREGGDIYRGLAVVALFYVLYMAEVSRSIRRTARDMLLLRNDKNALIEALAKSKADSDEARDRAETASRAKSEFLANMSHELRTPLNAILGFSEMMQDGALSAMPERQVEYARIINGSGHHLLALINDILDLAKIEAGRLSMHDVELDIAALIADCIRLLDSKARDGEIVIEVDVTPALPALVADDRAMRQVLLNLISNAVKFTPPGGDVCVFAYLGDGGALCIGVRDTGVGIADEDIASVFQHFGQGRHDVVAGDKGTGLGLPIVKGLVEAHDGRVELTSAVGEGTTVTIHLPAERLRAREQMRRTG